jgi:NB-ARC domain
MMDMADTFQVGQQLSASEKKSYYHVPLPQTGEFVGREDDLEQIELKFSLDGFSRLVVIKGLGGQGKTQLALDYCRRSKANGVRAIFWLDASSDSSVRASFENISAQLKGSLEEIIPGVEFVKERLSSWPDTWILVFDNSDGPAAFNIFGYVPNGESGRILVTTRNGGLLIEPERLLHLEGLTEQDALDLLLKKSHLASVESHTEDGKAIVKRLGYHPLAIAQAASYVAQRRITLDEFMNRYNQQRKISCSTHPK